MVLQLVLFYISFLVLNSGIVIQYGLLNYDSGTIKAAATKTVDVTAPISVTTLLVGVSVVNGAAFTTTTNKYTVSSITFVYSNKNNSNSSSFSLINFILVGY